MRPRELPAEDTWSSYEDLGATRASMRPRELPAEDDEAVVGFTLVDVRLQ